MRTSAILVLLIGLATSVSAAVVHDESVNGDLSSNPAAPTPLAFAPGSNLVLGTISGVVLDRDYLTFTVGPGQTLAGLDLLAFGPDNIAFCGLTPGATSVIPSISTMGFFLSGIHITAADVGFDLLVFFDNRNVTTNSLPFPNLGPGTYSFVIQQTSPVTQNYTLDFFLTGPVPTEAGTWGRIKALYR